ncbi:hypothetical protein [Hahella sp. HN01]|uniref:hypothetical protein n=1 Tax=Hahella sp. HN01 TaxID=2847262 RepID=UPI001C1F1A72|nr:hypothetical protein [Hahella sp. HN01]MBU6953626.1 hypothetical protein [Hahella sp. HN01]
MDLQAIFELEIWSQPGGCCNATQGLEIEKLLKKELPSSIDFIVGHDFSPNNIDVENLSISMQEKELKESNFKSFCIQRGLSPDLNDSESAARFLEYSYGRLLAWVHLPHDELGKEIFIKLVKWLSDKRYNLQGADANYCVNLSHAGDAPLFWYE